MKLEKRRTASVIVVDDGSSDLTVERMRAAGAQLVEAPTGADGDPLAAVPPGGAGTSGNPLVFLDIDCTPGPRRVEAMLGALGGDGGRRLRAQASACLRLEDMLLAPRTFDGNLPLIIFDYLERGVCPVAAPDLPARRSVLDEERAVPVPPAPEGMAPGILELVEGTEVEGSTQQRTGTRRDLPQLPEVRGWIEENYRST